MLKIPRHVSLCHVFYVGKYIDLRFGKLISAILWIFFKTFIILLLQVHWVQCDGCELWLHLTCIGLKPEQVSEDEDFICRDCKPPNSKKPKVILWFIIKVRKICKVLSLKLLFLSFIYRPPNESCNC